MEHASGCLLSTFWHDCQHLGEPLSHSLEGSMSRRLNDMGKHSTSLFMGDTLNCGGPLRNAYYSKYRVQRGCEKSFVTCTTSSYCTSWRKEFLSGCKWNLTSTIVDVSNLHGSKHLKDVWLVQNINGLNIPMCPWHSMLLQLCLNSACIFQSDHMMLKK